MNYGPLIFLAAFFALASSWFGFVLTPQMQLGRLSQTNSVPSHETYPLARPGMARQGLEVYRANGCAYCHSQQVRQSGTVCDVLLTDVGTNQTAVIRALLSLKASLSEGEARKMLDGLPKPLLQGSGRPAADSAARMLKEAGAKSEIWIVPVGPDLARGWGKRRSVAEDFLFDSPVMPGSQQIGPDLANVGLRWPDANWQLLHLYNPKLKVPGSPMPSYRFLFEKRKIEHAPSPEALPDESAPQAGYEIVPKPEANALVAYLISLRADAPLYDAPLTVPMAPMSAAGTNAAAGGLPATNGVPVTTNELPRIPEARSTNAAPTNRPPK